MNIKMKRFMITILAGAVLSSMFVSCKSEENGKSGTAKIVFGTNKTDYVDSTFRDLADEFTKQNPDITVEIEGYNEAEQIIKTRAAAGELPDVGIIAQDMTGDDFPNYYLPIDDLGYSSEDVYAYETGVGSDGKFYGMPSSISYEGIVYNKKAFEKAGIDEVPRTIDELYEACEKLVKVDVVPLAINFKDVWPLDWYAKNAVLPLAFTGDPSYRNNLINTPLFSDDNGLLASFELLNDMNKKGYLEPDLMSTSWETFRKDHAMGNVAMAYMGTWYPIQMEQSGANKEDIGMFPFPGSKATVQAADYRYGIAKTTKHEDAAKKFMKFLWDEEDRFAKASTVLSPFKSAKVEDSTVAELLSYDDIPFVIADPIDPKVSELFNKSEIDLDIALQEYLTSSDPDKVLESYNEKWEQAKK